ncbi:MAG: hypothetical protein KTR32_00695 [Granulosicoccus sp.]|nr:hypothetical protein [Granulosicoccus sp.]
MSASDLCAQQLDVLIEQCATQAKHQTGISDEPVIVVSPYRFNPLGAHIDHQGGAVLARCLDQYTVLCFWPSEDTSSSLSSDVDAHESIISFLPTELKPSHGWDAMARAAACAFDRHAGLRRGIKGAVVGTLVSGGLSSSASVILAYLTALAHANCVNLQPTDLVELSRQVENDYRGLNNGIQDQMSIAFARAGHMAKLDVENVSAQWIADPPSVNEIAFLMCYSGISRDLAGSGFNTRVAECRQAAAMLSPSASHLGMVEPSLRDEESLQALPALLHRRARHVYTEMNRVSLGAKAWSEGNWQEFGRYMNDSCRSSIQDYESGSEWLIALHEIASTIDGVYGNRFSGGGYGGCLFMLVDAVQISEVARQLLDAYLARYPELEGSARISLAQPEGSVRIESRP